jgi:hypothetical protein
MCALFFCVFVFVVVVADEIIVKMDPKTKRCYYYNPNSGQSHWKAAGALGLAAAKDLKAAGKHGANGRPSVAGVQAVVGVQASGVGWAAAEGAGAEAARAEGKGVAAEGAEEKAKMELELELKKLEVEMKRLELEEVRTKADAENIKLRREKEQEEKKLQQEKEKTAKEDRASVHSSTGLSAEMLTAHGQGEGEWKGRAGTVSALEHAPFAEGQIVDANYRSMGHWERGVVTAVKSAGYTDDGTPDQRFDIAFLSLSAAAGASSGSTDEVEENVDSSRLRAVDDHQAYHSVTEEVDICIGTVKCCVGSQFTTRPPVCLFQTHALLPHLLSLSRVDPGDRRRSFFFNRNTGLSGWSLQEVETLSALLPISESVPPPPPLAYNVPPPPSYKPPPPPPQLMAEHREIQQQMVQMQQQHEQQMAQMQQMQQQAFGAEHERTITHALPSPWLEMQDAESNTTWYFNPETSESTWEHPTANGDTSIPPPPPVVASSMGDGSIPPPPAEQAPSVPPAPMLQAPPPPVADPPPRTGGARKGGGRRSLIREDLNEHHTFKKGADLTKQQQLQQQQKLKFSQHKQQMKLPPPPLADPPPVAVDGSIPPWKQQFEQQQHFEQQQFEQEQQQQQQWEGEDKVRRALAEAEQIKTQAQIDVAVAKREAELNMKAAMRESEIRIEAATAIAAAKASGGDTSGGYSPMPAGAVARGGQQRKVSTREEFKQHARSLLERLAQHWYTQRLRVHLNKWGQVLEQAYPGYESGLTDTEGGDESDESGEEAVERYEAVEAPVFAFKGRKGSSFREFQQEKVLVVNSKQEATPAVEAVKADLQPSFSDMGRSTSVSVRGGEPDVAKSQLPPPPPLDKRRASKLEQHVLKSAPAETVESAPSYRQRQSEQRVLRNAPAGGTESANSPRPSMSALAQGCTEFEPHPMDPGRCRNCRMARKVHASASS